jgi:hypothetical protein
MELCDDTLELLKLFEKSLNPDIVCQHTLLLWDLYCRLLRDTMAYIETEDNKEILKKILLRLIESLLTVTERAVDCILVDDFQNPNYYTEVSKSVLQLTLLITSCLNKPKMVTNFSLEPLLHTCLKIMEKLSIIFNKIFDKCGMTKLNSSNFLRCNWEGIDGSQEVILETSHPIERGKSIQFDQLNFPGAHAICIELDPRCKSDERDNLVLMGWYSQHKSTPPTGNIPQSYDNLGVKMKFSGDAEKWGEKKIYLFGNCLMVNINSSALVINSDSLVQWGFKLSIRPIYGFSDNLENFLTGTQLAKNLQDMAYNIICCTDRFAIAFLMCLESYLAGGRTSSKEKQMSG